MPHGVKSRNRSVALVVFLLVLPALLLAGTEPTVYVTKTGSKYHADGCRHLAKSKIAMKLCEAAKSYTPCSVCDPPVCTKPKNAA